MCQGLGPKKHDEISEIDRIYSKFSELVLTRTSRRAAGTSRRIIVIIVISIVVLIITIIIYITIVVVIIMFITILLYYYYYYYYYLLARGPRGGPRGVLPGIVLFVSYVGVFTLVY